MPPTLPVEGDSFANQSNADLDAKPQAEYLLQDPATGDGLNVAQSTLDARYRSKAAVLTPQEIAYLEHASSVPWYGDVFPAHYDPNAPFLLEETVGDDEPGWYRRTNAVASDTKVAAFDSNVVFDARTGGGADFNADDNNRAGSATGMSPDVLRLFTDGRGRITMVVAGDTSLADPGDVTAEIAALDGSFEASIRFRRQGAYAPGIENLTYYGDLNPAEPKVGKAFRFSVLSTANGVAYFTSATSGWAKIQITAGRGADGEDGWTPRFAVVSDSERRVLQVEDWVGGEGTKPATGQYVGSTGLVASIGDGVDIRGPQGGRGPAGTDASGVGRRIGKSAGGKIMLASSLTGNQQVTIRRLA